MKLCYCLDMNSLCLDSRVLQFVVDHKVKCLCQDNFEAFSVQTDLVRGGRKVDKHFLNLQSLVS